MLCVACKEREATVHLTACVPNEPKAMQKIDFCEQCAIEKGLPDAKTLPLGSGMMDTVETEKLGKLLSSYARGPKDT